MPPEDELWLFVDTVTGLPVKPEMHNERWHRVRAWVETHDPDNAWPRTIVYRNLRHHAATNWFHEQLGEPCEVVAQYLGDKLTTVLKPTFDEGWGRSLSQELSGLCIDQTPTAVADW